MLQREQIMKGKEHWPPKCVVRPPFSLFTCLATTQQRLVTSLRDPGVVSLHVNVDHFSTTARQVTWPTWGPPPPCKQALICCVIESRRSSYTLERNIVLIFSQSNPCQVFHQGFINHIVTNRSPRMRMNHAMKPRPVIHHLQLGQMTSRQILSVTLRAWKMKISREEQNQTWVEVNMETTLNDI